MSTKKRPHWYYIYETYCPLCGAGETDRERRYGRRPKRYENRHSYKESYDWCDQ